jgi:hypothetical protein
MKQMQPPATDHTLTHIHWLSIHCLFLLLFLHAVFVHSENESLLVVRKEGTRVAVTPENQEAFDSEPSLSLKEVWFICVLLL